MPISVELMKRCPHLPETLGKPGEGTVPNQRFKDWLDGAAAMADILTEKINQVKEEMKYGDKDGESKEKSTG